MDSANKKKELIVRIVCVIISFGLWLYITNVENPIKDYKLNSVPVQILNEESLKGHNLVIAPNQKFYINLDLEGKANEIYKVKPEDFKITANLEDYALKKGENQIPVEVSNYPTDINIKNTEVLKVKVILDDYEEKTLPISTNVKIESKDGYYASEPEVSPKTAVVSGPSQCVSRVKKLTVKGEIKDIKGGQDVTFPVIAIDENGEKVEFVNINEENAKVSYTLAKGITVPINIKTDGALVAGKKLKGLTASIEQIEIIGDPKELQKIKSIDTEPIKLSNITDNTSVNVAIKLPNGISSVRGISSVKVDIAIVSEKEDTKVTKIIKKNISVVDKDKSFEATLDKETIEVTITGLSSDILNFKEEDLSVTLSLANQKEGTLELEPNVQIKNDKISIVSVDPPKIKVTIVKKEQVVQERDKQ